MLTNELKKGDVVRLRNGWYAVIADNMKGNIRMATVYGHYTETGSVYAHDIAWKLDRVTNDQLQGDERLELVLNDTGPIKAGHYIRTPITHTPAQLKLRTQTYF